MYHISHKVVLFIERCICTFFISAMVKGRYGRKLTRLQKQFCEENGARHAAQAAAAQNPTAKRPRNVDSSHDLHAHTSIDVTNMGRPSVRTVYYPAPKVTPATPAHTEADGSISETFNLETNFDAVDDAYVDFLAEQNTNAEPVKSKRDRTPGVGALTNLLFTDEDNLPRSRMIHKNYGHGREIVS